MTRESNIIIDLPFSEFTLGTKVKYDYLTRTDGQPVYIGYAPSGATENEEVWKIMRCTYASADPDADLMEKNWCFNVRWSERANLIYC